MIRVRIGSDERDMTGSIDEQWINQEINRRRGAGEAVCVRVTVQDGDINVALATPTCGGGFGGGVRPPNGDEQRIIERWNSRGLNQAEFTGGALVAFLHQLRH